MCNLLKSTISFWVLAAVLFGALVGLIGFGSLGFFYSSIFVHGASNHWRHCRGRGGTHYDRALPKRESRLAGQNSASNYARPFNRQLRWHRTRQILIRLTDLTPSLRRGISKNVFPSSS